MPLTWPRNCVIRPDQGQELQAWEDTKPELLKAIFRPILGGGRVSNVDAATCVARKFRTISVVKLEPLEPAQVNEARSPKASYPGNDASTH